MRRRAGCCSAPSRRCLHADSIVRVLRITTPSSSNPARARHDSEPLNTQPSVKPPTHRPTHHAFPSPTTPAVTAWVARRRLVGARTRDSRCSNGMLVSPRVGGSSLAEGRRAPTESGSGRSLAPGSRRRRHLRQRARARSRAPASPSRSVRDAPDQLGAQRPRHYPSDVHRSTSTKRSTCQVAVASMISSTSVVARVARHSGTRRGMRLARARNPLRAR